MGDVVVFGLRKEAPIRLVADDVSPRDIRFLAAQIVIPSPDAMFDDGQITIRGMTVSSVREGFGEGLLRTQKEKVLERILFFKRAGYIRDNAVLGHERVWLVSELMEKTYESAAAREDRGLMEIIEEMAGELLQKAAL